MKNSLKYLKLWQKKRSELPINDDQQNDWLQMQALLDKHMPVPAGSEIKPSRSKGFKVLSLMFGALSAAAMVYVFSYVIESKKHRANEFSYQVKRHAEFKTDSLLTKPVIHNSNIKGLAVNKTESIPGVKQNESRSTTPLIHKPGNGLSNNSAFTALSSQHKNNNLLLKGQRTGGTVAAGNFNNKQALSSSTNKVIRSHYPGPGKNGSSLGGVVDARVFNQGKTKEIGNNRSKSSEAPGFIDNADTTSEENPLLFAAAPKPDFDVGSNNNQFEVPPSLFSSVFKGLLLKNITNSKLSSSKERNTKEKIVKPKNLAGGQFVFSNMHWGVLTGVNSSGSFTPKTQNSNFYGAAPVDLFFGVFATYNLNAKWALNSQLKILSPQNVSYNYAHLNDGMLGSPQLQINSTGKIYSLEVPIQLSCRVNNFLSVLAGPSINIPVKQAGITNKLHTNGVKIDSAYDVALSDTINGTKYLQKLNFGVSGGLNFQIKRLRIGVMWNQSLTGYEIKSAFGTYKTKPVTFQFTVGWQLDKIKLKK